MENSKLTGLFSFDGPLYRDKNGVYCSVTLTNEMFSRYFKVVDRLYLVIRIFQSEFSYQELNMKPLDISNMRVIEVENLVSLKGLIIDKYNFERRIRSIIKKSDLIFCRIPSIISNSVIKVARFENKPYLAEVGGCAWDSYWNHSISGKIVAPWMFAAEKDSVRTAAYTTYVTKEFLQKRYPTKGINTNCSNVYLQPVDNTVLSLRYEKIKSMDNHKIVFGTASNSIDVRYKGEQYVIRTIKSFKKKGIDIEYQIAGLGKGTYLRKQAKKYGVEENVKFIGSLQKNEIFDWYKKIDVYIQPSKQEGLPRAVIEAMSTGCPALGSNIAGIPELLDQECLFDPDNTEEVVESIQNILPKSKMLEQAKINFERAKEYRIENIEASRQKIFLKYKNFVLKNRGLEDKGNEKNII